MTHFSFFRATSGHPSKATQRKGVAAGERKARKAGLAEEVRKTWGGSG